MHFSKRCRFSPLQVLFLPSFSSCPVSSKIMQGIVAERILLFERENLKKAKKNGHFGIKTPKYSISVCILNHSFILLFFLISPFRGQKTLPKCFVFLWVYNPHFYTRPNPRSIIIKLILFIQPVICFPMHTLWLFGKRIGRAGLPA